MSLREKFGGALMKLYEWKRALILESDMRDYYRAKGITREDAYAKLETMRDIFRDFMFFTHEHPPSARSTMAMFIQNSLNSNGRPETPMQMIETLEDAVTSSLSLFPANIPAEDPAEEELRKSLKRIESRISIMRGRVERIDPDLAKIAGNFLFTPENIDEFFVISFPECGVRASQVAHTRDDVRKEPSPS